jgi:DNA polymerase-1
LSLDTETTGLRPYHGDRFFSIIIAISPSDVFYFNFQAYSGLDSERILTREYYAPLNHIFRDETKLWFLHNAKFDMHILWQEGFEIYGTVHCTRAIGRVEYNEQASYDLEGLAQTIGLTKSRAVEDYIAEHELWEWQTIPGKKQRKKNKFYQKVPYEIIVPYGEIDGSCTLSLGTYQENSIKKKTEELINGVPSLLRVCENERRLTKTVFAMERVGIRIDKDYTLRAAHSEQQRSLKACEKFKEATTFEYKSSGKLFANLFANERDKWEYTDKGNPSFESGTLRKFGNPAAKLILEIRDAKSKSDFYNGFLYHADFNGDIHPNLNPDGAAHGRFSSSEPNLQNLTAEEGQESQEFIVRRAIIPRPGFIFIMPDYDQMEYRLMLDIAADLIGGTTPLIDLVKSGLDVHAATALEASKYGVEITRTQAKTSNFLTIYGGGNQKLADGLGIPLGIAQEIRRAIFKAAPEMLKLTETATRVAETRGYIRNWFGRRSYFPNSRFAYRATNYLVAGGCADVVKLAMNRIHDLLKDKKSRMVLTIHDELPCEIHESELYLVPQIKDIMENAYQSKYLPLTCGMEWSDKSLGDKKKGLP